MAVLAQIGPALAPRHEHAHGPWSEAVAAAAAHAPYLARLMTRRPDLCIGADQDLPQRLLDEAIAVAVAIAADPPGMDEGMLALRRAKDAVHLATAIADLSRAWPLMRVTGALTAFADASLKAALALATREMARRGEVAPLDWSNPDGPAPGFALIAMGKMGAGELNYSSDIDFSVFFDAESLLAAKVREPRVFAVRLVAPLVRALQEVTADGYVFRTDLRLRPDPGSTPVAVSLDMAERYYQSLGQNWERAAFIKARAAAGDLTQGRAFLVELSPFIWRKHLDFAAVADVHSIKRQILATHKSAELAEPVFDVKLGRGGIRDIELFAQTQQLILGGRNRALRAPQTLAALEALAQAGAITSESRAAMCEAYVFFREVEHRIQMLEDAQTHRVPAEMETRARLAALCGFSSLSAFERALVERRALVAEIDHALFGRSESLADPMGSLVFTGVEDDPETLRTIEKLGYVDPAEISQTIRGWHHGRIRAMRSERARELLTTLTPKLLHAFAQSGDADMAFARFNAFFSNLNAGVQVLSLLQARPALLERLARLLALAPRLAAALAQRPALMDAMIEPRFAQPLAQEPHGARAADLVQRLGEARTFEEKLNIARRFHREEAFRIGVQVLEGDASAEIAGAAHADLAEACVAAMADAARVETERLYGPAPGALAVLALGKFGGRELAEGSDLDIMLVYDGPEEARDFYTRMTQRLITALSSPTEEGELYEVDMQLRPSGSKGPVAVRLSSFSHYYREEAWTWELQAITRLRPVAGDRRLGGAVLDVAHSALARPRDEARTRADIADMRARMEKERRAKGAWDLKLAPGGFVDLEFIAQALQLVWAPRGADVLSANTGEAFAKLAAAGALSAERRALLVETWALLSDLQQVLRICVEGDFDPAHAAEMLLVRLTTLGRRYSFEALEADLKQRQAAVRALFREVIG
ncbi:MAG TPA: bifunctional [glutamine synthetase] adenylyltransferase/[glutamine synthetase]-adenylyl-L-tyrosine phosphorylase [Caulobacterales bacterium]|nr:bifunctional [glutamine synthetase] adenylyltransferase/[glutamine synthetase]-adenylyl-L-tyrosine phosphorylase [Caulobacterales bacterium]